MTPQYNPGPVPGSNSGLKTALAAGAIIASLAGNAFLLFQVNDLRKETSHDREVIQGQIDAIKENTTVLSASQRQKIDEVKADLEAKSKQANQAANQAKKEALTYAEEQARRLEAEQQRAQQQVASQISDVKSSADAATKNLASQVNTDITGVKSEIAGTKSDLANTQSLLKKVQGDLGVTSGFVATNGKEIEELRRRGERNIVEFTLKKQKQMQKVGDISLLLDKSDPKKNKFTVKVMADDKLVEKKDRNINEPLQFYVSKSLYELVINSVGKDQITGYLSTPKYQSTR